MAHGTDPTPVTPSPAKAERWEALVRAGLTPDSATAQVQREFAKADQWEALVASGLSPDSATARLNGAPPTATPAMASLLFGNAPGAPVLGSAPAQPPVGRTIAETQALANAPALTPDLVHQQVADEAARQGTEALGAALDPTGAQRFTSGLLSGAATAVGTLPTRAAHGLQTLGAATNALAARAVGRPDVATAIQTAALSGRLTAPADQATARIGQAIAGRLPVVGVPGQVGQFVGAQIPAVAAFEAALPEADAGTPALGRVAQMGTAGGIAAAATNPENPSAPLQGIAYGAGGELALQGVGAGLRGLGVLPDASGMPPTGDRRVAVDIPSAPKPFIRRVTDLVDPQGAELRDLNPVTHLPGANPWAQIRPAVDADPNLEVVSADSRGLKKVNDTVGPDAGDRLIQAQANAYRQAVVEAGLDPRRTVFTPKGDELYVVVPKGLGQAIGERATALMGEAPVGGLRTGTRFGLGGTVDEADRALNAAKAAEKAGTTPTPTSPNDFADEFFGEQKPSGEEGMIGAFGLRSRLPRSIEAMKFDKAPAQTWISKLRGNGNAASEFDWVVGEALRKDPTRVWTKAQLLDLANGNGIKLTERVLGDSSKPLVTQNGDSWRVTDPTIEGMEFNAPSEDLARDVAMNLRRTDATELRKAADRYERYAHSYPTSDPNSRSLFDAAELLSNRADALDLGRGMTGQTKFAKYQEPGGSNYREVLVKLDGEPRIQPNTGMHAGSHPWRVGTRVFTDETNARDFANGGHSDAEFHSAHWDDPNVLAHLRMNDRVGPDGEKVLHVEELQSDWMQKGRKQGFGTSGAPEAPGLFKDTPQWTLLGLKRALDEAVAGDYDRVSWTPGEQQAARYDLSKHIAEVHYSGTNLKAYDHAGKTVLEQTGVTAHDLPDLIGKEAAQKLLAQPKHGTLQSLTGQDLKVGGEGMKAYYDQILPETLRAYGKKLGLSLNIEPLRVSGGHTVPSIRITPELRAKIRGGQELGKGALPILGGLAGGIGGTAAGYASGSTPEERARNAILGGMTGLALGAGGGALAERGAEVRPGRSEGLPVGAPVPEGVQGPIRGPETHRIAQLDLSPEAAARVENIARQQGPPGYESWDALDAKVQRARAQQVGLTAADIAAWKRSGLDRVQIGAMNQVLLENQQRLDALAQTLTDPATPPDVRTAAQAEQQMLNRQSFDLFKSVKTGATGTARDLAALRKVWSLVGDTDAAWQLRGQEVAGRPLTALEQTKLKALKDAGNKAQALAYLGTLRPQGTWSQVLSQWKAGLLGLGALGAKTVGDIAQGVTTDAARVVGSGVDWLQSLATRERTMAPTFNLADRLKGAFGPEGRAAFGRAMRGLPSVAEEAAGEVPYNTTVQNTALSRGIGGAGAGALIGAYQGGPGHRLTGAAEGAAIGGLSAAAIPQTQPILNALYQGPFRLLKGISEQASVGAVRASLANQAAAIVRQAGLPRAQWSSAIAALVARPTEEMQLKAAKDALYDTMTNDTKLSAAGRKIQELPGGQVLMPFNRTPMSMTTKMAVDENPVVALPVSAVEATKVWRNAAKDIASEGHVSSATKAAQYRAALLFGQGSLMSLPFAYGYWKASRGEASGTVAPGDAGERGLRAETGTPPDAFWEPGLGQWVKFTRAGVQGQIAALGANVYFATHPAVNDSGEAMSPVERGLAGAQALGRQALDNPFFVGVNQATQLATGGQNAVVRYGHSMESSLVPSVVRGVASAMDPIARRATSPGEAFTRGMPGQSQDLYPERGLAGEPIARTVQGAQALGSPITATTPTPPPVAARALLTEWNRLGIPLTPPRQLQGESDSAYDARMQDLGEQLVVRGRAALEDAGYSHAVDGMPPLTDVEKAEFWTKLLTSVKGASTKQAKAQLADTVATR